MPVTGFTKKKENRLESLFFSKKNKIKQNNKTEDYVLRQGFGLALVKRIGCRVHRDFLQSGLVIRHCGARMSALSKRYLLSRGRSYLGQVRRAARRLYIWSRTFPFFVPQQIVTGRPQLQRVSFTCWRVRVSQGVGASTATSPLHLPISVAGFMHSTNHCIPRE